MDNYYLRCPAMMSDGRLFTDFRASQVREEAFKRNNNLKTENEIRTFITNNGEKLMNIEWDLLTKNNSCHLKKQCFHNNKYTKVTSQINNSEILMYNGDKQNTNVCNKTPHDYRMTELKPHNNIRENPEYVTYRNKYAISRPYSLIQ